MTHLPPGASQDSRRRFDLAWELAELCPSDLSQEIALTGSAARGIADTYSDIERSSP